MCILLPGNLYLRGVVAERPRSSNSTVFEAVVNRSNRTSPAVPAPPTGAVPSVWRLVVVLARLSSARRPAALAYGGARRCGGLPPGSASPPRPSRGLARSGVPPSRLGRAVGAFAPDYLCGVGFAVRFYGGWRRRGAYKVGR